MLLKNYSEVILLRDFLDSAIRQATVLKSRKVPTENVIRHLSTWDMSGSAQLTVNKDLHDGYWDIPSADREPHIAEFLNQSVHDFERALDAVYSRLRHYKLPYDMSVIDFIYKNLECKTKAPYVETICDRIETNLLGAIGFKFGFLYKQDVLLCRMSFHVNYQATATITENFRILQP